MYIKEILELNGYDVTGDAGDGMAAVNLCQEKKPDFAILDMRMPVMNGLQAAAVINREKLACFTLLLTAYSDKSIAKDAVDANVMGCIIKPVDENILIPSIEIAVNEYKKMHKLLQKSQKAKTALLEREYVDKAKSVLMQKRKVSEKSAYDYMRRVAMDKGCTISEVAKLILRKN